MRRGSTKNPPAGGRGGTARRHARGRAARRRFGPAVAALGLAMAASGAPVPAAARPRSEPTAREVYPYRMKGSVRLLFFWIGKDDVGGGTIAIAREPGPTPETWTEEIEVLFGSKPERVPGRHNRWGYGREIAEWERGDGEGDVLRRTVFLGFMRHSDEQDIDEVREGDGANELFRYDGTRSVVRRDEALSEIRFFSTEQAFDYREAEPIQARYRERLRSGGPDKTRRLENDGTRYSDPYGFLTATRALLRSIVASFERGDGQWASNRPTAVYVYNARLYRLRVRDIDHRDGFALELRGDGAAPERKLPIPDVAEIDFRIERIDTGWTHDFTLVVPLRGVLAGIPVRIVDKPRWWLRIELNLEPDETLRTRLDDSWPTAVAERRAP